MSRELGRRLITVDGALVLGVAAAELANVLLADRALPSYALLLAATLALLAHRRAPRVVLLVSSACVLAYLVWTGPDVIAVVPVLLAVFATVRTGHRLLAAAASLPFIVGALATSPLREGILPIGWFVASGVMGYLARAREAYLEQVEQRALEAERTREEVARRRAVDERLRIARELHDSLTHSISIIKVQAGVAAHLARKRGEEVPAALSAIQEAGSEAMRELRSTLEVLRDDHATDRGDGGATFVGAGNRVGGSGDGVGDDGGDGVGDGSGGDGGGGADGDWEHDQGEARTGSRDGQDGSRADGSGNGPNGGRDGAANGRTGHGWPAGHTTPTDQADRDDQADRAADTGRGSGQDVDHRSHGLPAGSSLDERHPADPAGTHAGAPVVARKEAKATNPSVRLSMQPSIRPPGRPSGPAGSPGPDERPPTGPDRSPSGTHGSQVGAGSADPSGPGRSPSGPPTRPAIGLDRLGGLVERTRSAGLRVTVTTSGTSRPLPAEPDRTAYRIVQEALTNVARHAGAASASVLIGYRHDTLLVQVDDDGRAALEAPLRPGVGLRGMHERADALGGTLSAGAKPGGGFRVRAELPLLDPTDGEASW